MSAEWFDGPPPSIGWWPASEFDNPKVLRWWNGWLWSVPVPDFEDSQYAGRNAEFASEQQRYIRWTHRPDSWPEWSKT